jgi:hypothetical protein
MRTPSTNYLEMMIRYSQQLNAPNVEENTRFLARNDDLYT